MSFLTPGYVRWDGTKYTTDPSVTIVGPAGPPGPAGVGPAGPPGATGLGMQGSPGVTGPMGATGPGLIIGGAPAIDGYHLYVYSLSENIGAITFANTGSGVNGALNFNGTANTDYVIASKAIGRTINSYRGLKTGTTNGGASSATTCSITGGSITLECFVRLSIDNSGTASFISADAGSVNDWICIQSTSVGVYYGAIGIGGIYTFTSNWNPQSYQHIPMHMMLSYNAATGVLNMFSNGVLVATGSRAAAPLATMTRVSIGAFGPVYSNQSFLGWVSQPRVSNIARDVTYALQTTETLFGM